MKLDKSYRTKENWKKKEVKTKHKMNLSGSTVSGAFSFSILHNSISHPLYTPRISFLVSTVSQLREVLSAIAAHTETMALTPSIPPFPPIPLLSSIRPDITSTPFFASPYPLYCPLTLSPTVTPSISPSSPPFYSWYVRLEFLSFAWDHTVTALSTQIDPSIAQCFKTPPCPYSSPNVSYFYYKNDLWTDPLSNRVSSSFACWTSCSTWFCPMPLWDSTSWVVVRRVRMVREK